MARKKDRFLIKKESTKRVWRAAIYTRVSVDRNGEKKDSLETQRMVAQAYASRHPEIEVIGYYEDDGISGTKFDRDSFCRMMEDIKQGIIDTVIVKDLSRFGRNLDEVSQYIEKIFPFMQVRFISVNDNYDSNDPTCDDKMLGIMISNLANDMYAKDASKKASTAMKLRMDTGEYCGGNAPYGYRRVKNAAGKHITEIDPLTAPYAKEIFLRIANGDSYSLIARKFNEMLLSPPKIYAKTGEVFVESLEQYHMHWGASTIRRIAGNKHYLGNTYTHKTRTSLITDEKNTLIDESEWMVHENTHEPLITQGLFDKVQRIIYSRKRYCPSTGENDEYEENGRSENKYIGILKCGECGAGMSRQYSKKRKKGGYKNQYYFLCLNYMTVSREVYTCNRWREEVLDQLVYNAIKNQMNLAVDLIKQIKQFNTKYYEPYYKLFEKERAKLLQLLDKNETVRLNVYEKYATGEMTSEEYREEMKRIEEVKQQFTNRLDEIAGNVNKIDSLKTENFAWLQGFIKGCKFTQLTSEIVHSYIEEIHLFEDRRIEIVFKFQDEMLRLVKSLEEGEKICQTKSA